MDPWQSGLRLAQQGYLPRRDLLTWKQQARRDNNITILDFYPNPNVPTDAWKKVFNIALKDETLRIFSWEDGEFEAIVPVGDLIVYAFFFIVLSDQHERLAGETLGTLCYYFPIDRENPTAMYSRMPKLREGAKTIVAVMRNSYCYHGNKDDNTLPLMVKTFFKKWRY